MSEKELIAKLRADVELLRRNAEGLIHAADNHYVEDPEFSMAYNLLTEALAATAEGLV